MRTITMLCFALFAGAPAIKAQTVSTFDTIALTAAHADTFYVNYSAPGTDVGFSDGLAYFPCNYDISFGYPYWSYGFAYSNMTDSVHGGLANQYSARAGSGYGGSHSYAVAYCSDPVTFAPATGMRLKGAAMGKPVSGFYVTNTSYAYYSMKNGDAFSRPFHNGDWFKLTIHGYNGGVLQPDSVGVYLADLLFPDTTHNFILDKWQWVNLLPLGHVDSLEFRLSSSDNGTYGMNTPAYFAMDNFTTNEMTLGAATLPQGAAARVYPNPAKSTLYVEITDAGIQQIRILDVTGRTVSTMKPKTGVNEINTAALTPGTYILQLSGNGKTAASRFIKE